MEFESFKKISRLSRDTVVTEKLDGTNAQIFIDETGNFLTGSRNRWITPDDDNFGFSRWAHENKEELLKLGPGRHFGEWYGPGIQRGYGLKEKAFALFNTHRWSENRPDCCQVVPILYEGIFSQHYIDIAVDCLRKEGSKAVPGFMRPEGIVVFHKASNILFKKTLENDDTPKGRQEPKKEKQYE